MSPTNTSAREPANTSRTVNHSPHREVDRRPEAVLVVQLPRGDAVEDRVVLHRIRVPDLVRPHVERLVVVVVPDPPRDAVEGPLAGERHVDLDHAVGELDAGDRRDEVDRLAEGDARPAAELGCGDVAGRPAPRGGVERDVVELRHSRHLRGGP